MTAQLSSQAHIAALGDHPGEVLSRERAALALSHLGLADALAHRYWKARQDWADLQQVARLGLVKAAIRYRLDEDSNFVGYAVPTISGEIKRYLRDHSWMVRPPRRVQELRSQIRSASPELAQALGHEPSARELAQTLSVEAKDIEEAVLSDNSVHPDSLDAPGLGEVGTALFDRLGFDDDAFELVDELVSLRCALRGLTPWERTLLSLRFQDELKQQDIADILNVSQMQVSRALSALLAKLHKQLSDGEVR